MQAEVRRDPRLSAERLILAGIVLGGLALRLWSIGYGMPFAFNADEELHFVPVAVDFFTSGTFNPGYFENPPLLAYSLYGLFRLRFTGSGHFAQSFANDPEAAYITARVFVCLIGTGLIALVYWAGRRFYDARVGLVAAALIAFTFLPVFYSHFALNDVLTMAPVTLTLVLSLIAWQRGGWKWWALAGAAAGLACATKYTSGLSATVVVVAAVARWRGDEGRFRDAVKAGLISGVCFGIVFLLLNPFALIDLSTFRSQLGGQSSQAGGTKLGQTDVPGWAYYGWTLLWGFGVLPLLAAVGGAVVAFRDSRWKAALLVVLPLLMFLFLGSQGRFFARWLMPAYPALAILAGVGAVWLARNRTWALALISFLLVIQGASSAIRVDAVLGRNDTRLLAKDWLERNVPAGAKIAIEPFVPDGFLTTGGRKAPERFDRYPIKRPFQAYEKKLTPTRIDRYRVGGYCWVIVASHQKDRGLGAHLPGAGAYYKRLDAESDRTVIFSPYRPGEGPVKFSYDFSFDYYPRAYLRPGPLVEIHHLRGCR